MTPRPIRFEAIDAALLITGAALWVGVVPIVTFHLVFVMVTVAAFRLSLRRFILRLVLGTALVVVGIALAISSEKLEAEEMLEVPLLALISGIVFLIARSRSRTEASLRSVIAELHDVTRESEMLVNSVPAVVYTAELGADGRWLFASPQARQMVGIDAAQLIGGERSWFDAIHPEDRDRVLADELHALETNTQLESEYRIRMPDGTSRWVRDEAMVVPGHGADRPCFHGVITDITAHKQIQRELATRIQQEAAIAEIGRTALEDHDVDRVLDHAVRLVADTLEVEYCKVLELLPDESGLLLRAGVGWGPGLVGTALVGVGHESQAGYTLASEDPIFVEDLATETRFSGPSLLLDHEVVSGLSTIIRDEGRPYGVLGVHSTSLHRFSPADGEFLSAVANVLAATLRLERAEAQLDFQQRRFEAAFEAALSAIALVRPDGGFISVNSAMARMLGYSAEELIGSQDFKSITHPDDVHACSKAAQDIIDGERDHVQILSRYLTRQGQTRWAELSLAAVRDEEGEVLYLVAQCFDVTARLTAEATRERFFETSIDLLCIAGFDGYFKELNRAWEETLGFTREELMAVPYLEFVHPDDRRGTSSEASGLAEGDATLEFSNRYVHKDGSVRWLEWRALPFREEGTIFAIARDVTAHRELEEQLRQSQKMQAVGRLAGGVAHDFNNLLAVILNYCEFVGASVAEDPHVAADLEEIRSAATRGVNLVNQLLVFSRKDVPHARPVQLNDVISGFEKLLTRTLGEDVLLSIDLGDDLPFIKCDPGHLDQIVMNLVVNARDAMPTGGALVLETSKVALVEPRETASGTVPSGTYVCLTVSDTGSGIAPADLEHVFEPFFTTKGIGEGTGLGLATTYANVVEAGGYISVHSEPGQGSTFSLFWPAVDAAEIAEEATERKPRRSGRAARVLVVEDDEAIRRILKRVLTLAGHQVVAAVNADEAIRAAAGQGFDLLLSDVIMPGHSGPEIAQELREHGHAFDVIYMSGYTDNVLARHAAVENGSFIQKPFQADELLRKIDEVLT